MSKVSSQDLFIPYFLWVFSLGSCTRLYIFCQSVLFLYIKLLFVCWASYFLQMCCSGWWYLHHSVCPSCCKNHVLYSNLLTFWEVTILLVLGFFSYFYFMIMVCIFPISCQTYNLYRNMIVHYDFRVLIYLVLCCTIPVFQWNVYFVYLWPGSPRSVRSTIFCVFKLILLVLWKTFNSISEVDKSHV